MRKGSWIMFGAIAALLTPAMASAQGAPPPRPQPSQNSAAETQPSQARTVRSGRYFGRNSPVGADAVIVTSNDRARSSSLLRLAGW